MHSPVTLISRVQNLDIEIFDHHRLNVYFIPNIAKKIVVFFLLLQIKFLLK
jgi:hypothetical protein